MKKFFKTKFKKIISIFTAIVILTLVLIIPVSAAGQNLFYGTWEQGRIFENGSVASSVLFYITSSSVNLSPGTYIISVPSNFQVGYVLFNSSGSPISNNLIYSSNNIEFTTSVNCSIRICLHRSNNDYLYPSYAPDVSLVFLNYVNYTEFDIDQFNFTIPSISNSYGSVEPTQHELGYNLWYTSLNDINPISFSDIGSFNWYVSLSANSQLQEGYYTFSLSPVFLFDSNISSNVGSAKVTLTLGSDEKVVVSQTVAGSKVSSFGNSNSVKYDLQFSIYYDPKIHQQLFNDFTLNFNFLNSSVSGNLYYIGFNTAPKLLAPDSISSGASAALDNNAKIEEEITKQPFHNSLSNIFTLFQFSITDFFTFRDSFLAIRQVFDEFFGNFYNLTVAYLCLALSIIVVISRYMRNRRD